MGLFDTLFGAVPEPQPGQNSARLGGFDPVTMGLLSAAAAGFEASGPSRVPVSNGQAIARMFAGGMRGYENTIDRQEDREDRQMMRDYRKAQIADLGRKSKAAADLDAFFKNRLYGAPGVMPAADMAASVDSLGQGAAVGDVGPTATNAARMDAIRPPQFQGQNSAFPFGLNDIAYLKTKGVDLADVYKLATDPIKLEGGSTYRDRATGAERYMPKVGEGMNLGPNGAVSLAPGYLDSMGAIKGTEAMASERAKASFDPFYSIDPQGNKVLSGSRLNALNGGGFPLPAQPGMPGMPGGLVTERSPAANAYDQDVAKDFAARYAAINKSGFTAPSQIAKLERIGKLLEDHEGGKLSQTGLELAQYANSMGFKIDKSLANKEAAAALSNELALSLRDPSNGAGMPGAMSDADRQFLTSMSPNLGQSREGRQQILNAGVALQKRNQQVAEMARKYSKKYGRVDENFYTQLEEWANRNPVFGGQ